MVLREQVWERSGGWCEWPACEKPGTELAHLHSIGAGGRRSADTPSNVMLLCRDHARISDGEYGSGGRTQYEEAHETLLGADWAEFGAGLAWERAEALTALVASRIDNEGGKEDDGAS